MKIKLNVNGRLKCLQLPFLKIGLILVPKFRYKIIFANIVSYTVHRKSLSPYLCSALYFSVIRSLVVTLFKLS